MEILAITTKYAPLKFLIVFDAYKEIATFVYVYWSRLLFYNNFFTCWILSTNSTCLESKQRGSCGSLMSSLLQT